MRKILLATGAAMALLAGVTAASAQMDGRPADDKAQAAQGQERNPNGAPGGSVKNPSINGSATTGSGISSTGGAAVPRRDESSSGSEIKAGGTSKGEVGGQAPEGH